jgi:hypothetical protein
MNIHATELLPGVRTTLNYFAGARETHFPYDRDPMFGGVASIPDVLIRDARPISDQLSLDEQGFELRQHRTQVTDFYDETQIADIYRGEIERLLLQVMGAEKVMIVDRTIRSIPKFLDGVEGIHEPVRRVHNDYTAASGRRRVCDLLGYDEAEMRLQRRFAEVNVWRPIQGPLEDAPLAVCDARSISEEEMIASDLICADKTGETCSFRYSRNHRWFYLPKMRPDEVLLIKCHDSAEGGIARFTAHTAFDDPTTPQNALPHESIEVRALVFFGR